MQLMVMTAIEPLAEAIMLTNFLIKKRAFLIGENDYLGSKYVCFHMNIIFWRSCCVLKDTE